MEARLRQILRKKERLQASKVEKHTETDLLRTEHAESSPSLRVNLPKLQLPVFYGNIEYWQEFWDMFRSTADEPDLPAVSKFIY